MRKSANFFQDMIIDSLRYNNTLFRKINEHLFTTYNMQGMASYVVKYKSLFAVVSSQQTSTYLSYSHHSHSKVNLILHKSTACKIQPTYGEAHCCSDFCFQDHDTTLSFSHREKPLHHFHNWVWLNKQAVHL